MDRTTKLGGIGIWSLQNFMIPLLLLDLLRNQIFKSINIFMLSRWCQSDSKEESLCPLRIESRQGKNT
jgi:hypothetical protein